MRMNGLEAAVLKQASDGTLVMGICGGYQMLGMTLEDPDGVEEGGSMRGMELCRYIRFLEGEDKNQSSWNDRSIEWTVAVIVRHCF